MVAIRLYDGQRDVHYDKPVLRGWLHLLSFLASLALAAILLENERTLRDRTVAALYLACVAGLFGVSALYHRGRWTAKVARRLQRLDHTMIVLMIAGSATPALALSVPNRLGPLGLIVLWCLAGAAITIRLTWMAAPERLVGAIYIGLGWLAGAAIPAVWMTNGVAPALLLVAGGLLYTVGAISYHRRAFDFVPSIFGYHETFHAFICAAAACQGIAIGVYVI